ncbi:MAG: F0F1 ATP synthase subunit epsilon [Bradymonadales bacterium]|nr:MAG: F0F1 ATP synthase subunit epsilon [Bradymonadales bacterium]
MFQVKVATPERVIFDDSVDDLVIEGEAGQLNILERHTNFVSFIRPGPLLLRRNKQSVAEFSLSEGVLKVEGSVVMVLCSEAKAA